MQNSVSAGASIIKLVVKEDVCNNLLHIIIEDDGAGMTDGQLARLSDPFFTTRSTRKVGMGVPLFLQSAEQSGGGLVVGSVPGEGTKVEATFEYDNIDRPPLGDLAGSFILTVSANPQTEFILEYSYNENIYIFNTVEIKDILGEVSLNNAAVVKMLTEMVSNNISGYNESYDI